MKKIIFINTVCFVVMLASCSKSSQDEVSITPSTSVATVGQTISVTLNAKANASSWTVSPSASASKQFAITTQKINYFTFSSPGQYTIGVRTRDIAYDSTRHQSLDSCWRNGGGDRGGCKRGLDSASVSITVK